MATELSSARATTPVFLPPKRSYTLPQNPRPDGVSGGNSATVALSGVTVARNDAAVARHSPVVARHSAVVALHRRAVARHSVTVARNGRAVARHRSTVARHSRVVARNGDAVAGNGGVGESSGAAVCVVSYRKQWPARLNDSLSLTSRRLLLKLAADFYIVRLLKFLNAVRNIRFCSGILTANSFFTVPDDGLN